MERYYTIPMEVGLSATPGVDTIRSNSFYGLSFVRVTFKYGVDYYFAYTQAALNLQQKSIFPTMCSPLSRVRAWWAKFSATRWSAPRTLA